MDAAPPRSDPCPFRNHPVLSPLTAPTADNNVCAANSSHSLARRARLLGNVENSNLRAKGAQKRAPSRWHRSR